MTSTDKYAFDEEMMAAASNGENDDATFDLPNSI
jgi:hypothetical protein